MSRSTTRTVIIGSVVALCAALASVSGAPSASGQQESGPVPIVALADPPASVTAPAESAGTRTSPAYAGTGQFERSGLAPEATVARGTHGGTPLGAESVIGGDGRIQVTKTTRYPARAIGQIELNQNGDSFICTGWLIDPNTILTSGHCSYDPTAGGGDVIESAQFFPGRNGGTDPYGGCNVVSVYARPGWKVNGRQQDDWSIQQLDCNIGNTVGYLGYFTVPGTNALDGKPVTVQGYPGDKPPGTQWKMSGNLGTRSNANSLFYPMDTAGGQSGSPIFQANRPSCGGPCGAGIHSYGAGGSPLNNSGPRITATVFSIIQSKANANNP